MNLSRLITVQLAFLSHTHIELVCIACAFEGLTADLEIQQQLKPTQSDIHIDMDKLIA